MTTFDIDSFFGAAATAAPPRISTGHGGARPNSGPKKGHKSAKKRGQDGEELTDYQRMERARADKEEQLARQAKVKADLDEGAVVSRDAVQNAAIQAFAAISQSLDSIGDVLERDGIELKVCLRVMELINSAKSELMSDLRKIHVDAAEAAGEEQGDDDGE